MQGRFNIAYSTLQQVIAQLVTELGIVLKPFDEIVHGVATDYTPEEYGYEPNELVYKPHTATQHVYVSEELQDLYAQYVRLLESGDIVGAVIASQRLLELLHEERYEPDLVDAIYGAIMDPLLAVSSTLLQVPDDSENPIDTAYKLGILAQTLNDEEVIAIVTGLVFLLYVLYVAQISSVSVVRFQYMLIRRTDLFARALSDILGHTAIRYAQLPDEQKSQVCDSCTLIKLLIFAGLLGQDALDSFLEIILAEYQADIVAKLVDLYTFVHSETGTEPDEDIAYVFTQLALMAQLMAPDCVSEDIDFECLLAKTEDIVDEYLEYLEKQASQYETKLLALESHNQVVSESKESAYVTDFTIHEHRAKKAGLHYDLRIRVGKKVMSIAFRKPIVALPKGEKRQGFVQPIHTLTWLDFEGEIPEGYGAGTLDIVAKGKVEIYKTQKGTIVMHFIDEKNGVDYWYAFVVSDADRKAKNHPVLLVSIGDKSQSEHLERPTIREILEYFGYTPGSELMNVEVDI